MQSQNLETIKKVTKEFFQKTGLNVEVEIGKPQDLTIPVDLEMEDPQLLIGERGGTLAEIQHLLKAMLKRKVEEPFYIDLDINDYKKKKTEYLKELAQASADEVVLSKKEKILPSMPSYERRIIHLKLAERGDVVTESIGREPERKVVIKPYP